MKYKSKKEFIKSCNRDKALKNSIRREITELDLEEYNIQPDIFGKFGGAQKLELITNIRKKEGFSWYKKEQINQIEYLKSEALKGDTNAQRFFLLFCFSKKFKQDIKKLRKRYYIPLDGFKNNLSYLCKWCTKQKKKIVRSKSKKKFPNFLYPEESKRKYMTEEEAKVCQKTFFDVVVLHCCRFDQEKAVSQNYKFEKEIFNLGKHFVLPELDFFKEANKIYIKYKLNILFYNFAEFVILGGKPRTSRLIATWPHLYLVPKQDYLNIQMSSHMLKEHLLEFINKNWPTIKKELNKVFGASKKKRNLYRDFLIAQLHSQGKESKDISNIMKKEFNYKDLKKDNVRKILNRLKEEIEGLESET